MNLNVPLSIPVDIEEAIIGQCQDDDKLLSICALVCQDWRKRSQFHIFRAINIRARRQVYDLRDVLILNRLLASLVRMVSIRPSPPEHRFLAPSLFDTAAMTLLPFLTNLRTWRFSGNTEDTEHSGRPLYLSRSALHLFLRAHQRAGNDATTSTLELYRVTFASYPELVRTAQAFPQLQHLLCNEIEFERPLDPSSYSRLIGLGKTALAQSGRFAYER